MAFGPKIFLTVQGLVFFDENTPAALFLERYVHYPYHAEEQLR